MEYFPFKKKTVQDVNIKDKNKVLTLQKYLMLHKYHKAP